MIRLQGEMAQYLLEGYCEEDEYGYDDYEPYNPRLDVNRIAKFKDSRLCTLLYKMLKSKYYALDAFSPMMESILKQQLNGRSLSSKQKRAAAVHIVKQRIRYGEF